MTDLEQHFKQFRDQTIGIQQTITGPYGEKTIVYADWTASGRLYSPIEDMISNHIGAFIANTHTETSSTGCIMTHAYHRAKQEIKKHVNAAPTDAL
ncbi:MAG: selenocysteine lyase, partial [Saprospiraceae bacterium]|nr:selenocysteine lyase [Saprospiraceae bacterium]